MTTFIKRILETSEERIKNPLIWSFSLSFVALNWKAFALFLFSSLPMEVRIEYISKYYIGFWTNIGIPLGVALLYVGVLPYINSLLDELTFKAYEIRSGKMREMKEVDLAGKILVANKEAELESARANYKEKADLNNIIYSLREQLTEVKDKNEVLVKENNFILEENNNLKFRIDALRELNLSTEGFVDVYEIDDTLRLKNKLIENNYYDKFRAYFKNGENFIATRELSTDKNLFDFLMHHGLIIRSMSSPNSPRKKVTLSDKGKQLIQISKFI